MRAHLEHARYVFVAHDDGLKFPIRPPVHPELSRPASSRPHPTRARRSVGRSIHPRPHFTLDARASRSSASVAVAPPLIATDTPPVETPRARAKDWKKDRKKKYGISIESTPPHAQRVTIGQKKVSNRPRADLRRHRDPRPEISVRPCVGRFRRPMTTVRDPPRPPETLFRLFHPPRASHLSLKVVSETPTERAASVAGSDTRAKSSSSPNSRACA